MVLLESLVLPMGSDIIPFKLPATDGNSYGPEDFADKKALVVIFMCNHCPYIKATIDRMIQLQAEFADKGVQLVGINANDSENYPEDSFEAMQAWVEEKGINFPYLHDESQEIARAYQAQCTPDIFVFNAERKLAYHGRIDDNWQEPEKATKRELAEALDVVLEGGTIPEDQQKPTIGCSIKWK